MWKKESLVRLLTDIPFDGLNIAEPYLPEWNGLESGTYGDVGPHAQALFQRRFGIPIPEFKDRSSPRYYKKTQEVYAKWIRFRVDGVNTYLDDIVNGVCGVREARPDIRIATWTLAVDAGPDSQERLRELQGNDAVSMIAKVKPDIHYLQTHWPDWGRSYLPPEYVRSYRPFVESIRAAFPSLPIGIQTDIGSAKRMIRSREWIERFEAEVRALGCAATTAYEYHLGGALYDEAPQLVRAERSDGGAIRLSFHKRVAPPSMRDAAFFVRIDGTMRRLSPARIAADGNRLLVSGSECPDCACEIGVRGIADTPELLLYPPMSPKISSSIQWTSLLGIH